MEGGTGEDVRPGPPDPLSLSREGGAAVGRNWL